MKKILKTIIIISIAVLGAGFLAPSPVYAVDELEVNFFGHDPLFDEANFLPGGNIARDVKVTNNTDTAQSIITEAIEYPGCPDPDDVPSTDLSRALDIVIREKGSSSDLYGGSTGIKSLFDFYTRVGFGSENELLLTQDLAGNGGNITYEFEISFPSGEENEWQGTTTTFDILIGFQGDGGGAISNGGSGSGGGLPPGLMITNERDDVITTATDITALITWQTNYFSTSKVIYGATQGQFNFSAGPERYGYDFYKEGDNSGLEKVTVHNITLTGLDANATYYYRCVSHASPDTIGFEHSFTTTLPEGVTVPEKEPGEGSGDVQETAEEEIKKEIDGGVYEAEDAEGLVLGETTEIEEARDTDQLDDEEPKQKKDEETAEEEEENGRTGLLAAIGGTFGSFGSCVSCFSWLYLFLFIIAPLMKLWAVLEKRDRTTNSALKKHYKRIATVWAIAFLAPASLTAWAYFANHHCVHIIYFWIFALLTVLSWWFDIRKTTMDIETLDNDDHQQTITKKQKLLLYAMFITLAIVLAIWLIFGCAPIWLILTLLAVNIVLRLFVKK